MPEQDVKVGQLLQCSDCQQAKKPIQQINMPMLAGSKAICKEEKARGNGKRKAAARDNVLHDFSDSDGSGEQAADGDSVELSDCKGSDAERGEKKCHASEPVRKSFRVAG